MSTSLWDTKLGWRVWAAGAWGATAPPRARGVEGGLGAAPVKSGPDELVVEAMEEESELTVYSNQSGGMSRERSKNKRLVEKMKVHTSKPLHIILRL